MRTLRAYVLREHAAPFFVTLGGLTAVLLVGNIIRFTELIVAKGVSLFDVLRLILYLIPYMFSFTVPMACLIAMVMAFGRLNSDYELIAMRASGIAPARLVFPLLLVGLLLSALMLVVNDRMVPASHLAFRQQLKAIGVKRPAAYLEAGAFIREFPPYTIFIYQVEGQRLYNVRIYEPQPNGPTRTIIAERGEFERLPNKRGVQLKLHDGTVDEWDLQNPGTLYKVTFVSYTMTLRSQGDAGQLTRKLKELTFKEMLAERGRLAEQQIETLPVSLELHRKIASSFSALIFAAFGLAFGFRLQHHERLLMYVWVLVVFVAYYLSSIGMAALALKGGTPAWLAMWAPNLFGALVSGALIAKAATH